MSIEIVDDSSYEFVKQNTKYQENDKIYKSK